MSSYIVNYMTMHRVATYTANKRGIVIYDKNDKLTEKFKELLAELWNMNNLALIVRYGAEDKMSDNKRYIRAYKYVYQKLPSDGETDINLLMLYFKSFCNYTYQCNEGDVDKMDLYREIEVYEKTLAISIACSLPEWGIGKWE